MVFTIDNYDGLGSRDYTAALDAERPPRVQRRLNRPSELRACLYAADTEFVVPQRGGRVILARNSGERVFTGYVTVSPEYEYMGWGETGPVYRYVVRARSDESLLETKTLPNRPAIVECPAGDALKQLTEDIAPGTFDTSAVEPLDALTTYVPDPRKTWPDHASSIAARARGTYRVEDGRLFFRALGAVEHTLQESTPGFCPEALRLETSGGPVNDVTVVGAVEPRSYIKDYFLADGSTLRFQLSDAPFTRPAGSIVDEEYRDASLRPTFWQVEDPSGAVSVNGGKLRVTGGTGMLGETRVEFAERLEIGGGLLLQHGDVAFSAASDAVLGGLYTGGFGIGECFAGFRVAPNGTQSIMSAVISGVGAGSSIPTVAGRRYLLTTHIYSAAAYRRQETFYSSAHPSGGGRGGGAISADVRLVLQVQEIDPNNPATLVAPATVLYDGWAPAAPQFCEYAVVNATGLHADIAFTRLARVADAEIRSCAPAGSWRSRLAGPLSDGAECRIGSAGDLVFYSASLPQANEKIVVRYRGHGRAAARMTDETSIAAEARGADDGRRGAVVALAVPTARTSDECAQAALALLDDSTHPGWTGEYQCRTDCLPSEIHPGDALRIVAPSRAINLRTIVREVEIEARDLLDDRSFYRLKFADEAAQPAALEFESAPQIAIPQPVSTAADPSTTWLAPTEAAEITDISSTQATIDAGKEPPAGGGFELRRSDSGWGPENDRNLVGRFQNRVFTVPRTSRTQTWYMRQYDASNPQRYSRESTVLHIDYPL